MQSDGARPRAVAAIVVGTAIVGFSPNRWDVVVVALPRGHGIHLNDILGSVLIALGTWLLWRASSQVAGECVWRHALPHSSHLAPSLDPSPLLRRARVGVNSALARFAEAPRAHRPKKSASSPSPHTEPNRSRFAASYRLHALRTRANSYPGSLIRTDEGSGESSCRMMLEH